MKIAKLFIPLLLTTNIMISCAGENPANEAIIDKTQIDRYLRDVMDLHRIPGLSLAIVQNRQVIYQEYFGEASLQQKTAVDKNTLFRVFSTTKLITATGIFQLIEKNQLHLEDELSTYLEHLPKPWREVKIKNLLSHSSGLPDMIRYKSDLSDHELMEKLSVADMEFETGSQFRYNQTNYWLLAQIIENITGQPFNEYILEHQFNKAKKGVLFSSNATDSVADRATRYFYNLELQKFEKDRNNSGLRGHAGNGLNITLDQFMAWNTLLDTDQLLEEKTKELMWSPFPFSDSNHRFAHGWGIYTTNDMTSYGFTGGNLSAFRKFPGSNMTIILLSNGYELPAYDIIVDDIARMVVPELADKTLVKEEEVMQWVVNEEFTEARQALDKLKAQNPGSLLENLKMNINGLGNNYMYAKKTEKALQVLKLNAEAFPEWWVASASLAEVYELLADTDNAIRNYEKAIALNTDNEWGYNEIMKDLIRKLRS